MESTIMAFSFASALVIAGCVVLFFSGAIDEALARVVPPEMTAAWRRYAKFALFVVALVGGLRVSELASLVALRVPGTPPLTGGQAFLEILKSIAGSLAASAIALLAFFVATLVIDGSRRLYQTRRLARPAPTPPADADRRPVGAERHATAGGRERRSGDNGSFL
ncbi:MAG TPA: hypothetical protein VN915_15970 [Elusimicrobiota bacterium]|nr:hypothetical protein [Elusimicrobiota bacterium]